MSTAEVTDKEPLVIGTAQTEQNGSVWPKKCTISIKCKKQWVDTEES